MVEQRYCMVKDDDGHTFIINVADIDDFNKLLEGDEDGLWATFHRRFDNCMLNYHPSSYTFTDPKNIHGEAL